MYNINNTVDELYRIFDMLNTKFFGSSLEKPVITIQKARKNNLGHFTLNKIWSDKETKEQKYEININPVNLDRAPVDITGTLLHEMIHYYHKVNDIKDATNNVHNKKFKTKAESVGMIVTKGKNGWGYTTCSEDLINYITEKVQPNEEYFRLFMDLSTESDNETTSKPREKKTFKYTCPNCGLEVKAKKDANIVCGECGVELEIEEDGKDD